MKKFLLTIAFGAATIFAMSQTVSFLYCQECVEKYTAVAPDNWAICTKDSTFCCNACVITNCATLEAAQEKFDSLYLIMPQDSITKWPEIR